MNKSLTILGVCLLAIAVGSTASKGTARMEQQSANDLPQVRNKTQSFKYLSIEKSGDLFNLKMRNDSKKGVTGYVLAFGRISEIETDLIIGNRQVAPGEVETIPFSATSLEHSAASGEPNTVTVALVVYEDRSSEGDFQFDARVRDKRLGIKTQLGLINQTLRASASASGINSLSMLRNLRNQVSSLPDRRNDNESESFRSGLDFATQWIAFLLSELENWEANGRGIPLRGELRGASDAKTAVGKLIDYCERLMSKY